MTDAIAFANIVVFEKETITKGFGFRNKDNAIPKLQEELFELINAIKTESKERQEEELGDLLYSIASVCRLHNLDFNNAAKAIVTKLNNRISKIEELSSTPINELSDDEQTRYIYLVKQLEKQQINNHD